MARFSSLPRLDPQRLNTTLRTGLLLLWLGLAGCASGPHVDPRDPLEPFNRGVFQFNDRVDRALIKPVASAYREVLPSPIRQGVNNFFSNLQDAWSFVNNTLQLKGVAAANSATRFGVNTFLGLGGLLDVASEMRIERHTKDFGHTLGYWGVGPGPYLMLPLLGPSTLRDTAALPVDMQGNLISGVQHVPTRNSLTAVKLLDQRSRLLQATDMLDQVALDPYTFSRDAFLQGRRSAVYDGNPPDEPESVPSDLENTAK
jgi:phospholipid-binding lipoprotein MlaA